MVPKRSRKFAIVEPNGDQNASFLSEACLRANKIRPHRLFGPKDKCGPGTLDDHLDFLGKAPAWQEFAIPPYVMASLSDCICNRLSLGALLPLV